MTALKEELQEKKATIEMGKLGEAYIIPFQFRQLLQNLVTNSLKFSRPDVPPHIIITSEYIKYDKSKPKRFPMKIDYCHVSVIDNGIGFNPKYKDRIFEIFQRLHYKEDYIGTGIGLAIVKKIVENHYGIITATSELDKGARFDIYIPAQPQ